MCRIVALTLVTAMLVMGVPFALAEDSAIPAVQDQAVQEQNTVQNAMQVQNTFSEAAVPLDQVQPENPLPPNIQVSPELRNQLKALDAQILQKRRELNQLIQQRNQLIQQIKEQHKIQVQSMIQQKKAVRQEAKQLTKEFQTQKKTLRQQYVQQQRAVQKQFQEQTRNPKQDSKTV